MKLVPQIQLMMLVWIGRNFRLVTPGHNPSLCFVQN